MSTDDFSDYFADDVDPSMLQDVDNPDTKDDGEMYIPKLSRVAVEWLHIALAVDRDRRQIAFNFLEKFPWYSNDARNVTEEKLISELIKRFKKLARKDRPGHEEIKKNKEELQKFLNYAAFADVFHRVNSLNKRLLALDREFKKTDEMNIKVYIPLMTAIRKEMEFLTPREKYTPFTVPSVGGGSARDDVRSQGKENDVLGGAVANANQR